MIEIMKSLYDIWAMFKSLTNDSRSAYLDNLQAFENHIRFILRWYRNKGFKDGEEPDYFTEDEKFFLINSNFKTKGGKFIYILIEIDARKLEYQKAIDIFDEKEFQNDKRQLFKKGFKMPGPPRMLNISHSNVHKGGIKLEYTKNQFGKYVGGTIGHFLVDGLDNFPLSYKILKWTELVENEAFSEERMSAILDNSMENYILARKSPEGISTDNKVNITLAQMDNDLNSEYNESFELWSKDILTAVFYLDKTNAENIAIPLYYNNMPYAVLISRYCCNDNKESEIVPMTLLKLSEIKRNLCIYSDKFPIWLNSD